MKNKNVRIIKGFTLPEMIIVIAVVAVLLAAGLPSMKKMIEGRQLVSQATEVASALAFARAEAASRSHRVVICASNDGVSCSGNNNWSGGWIIFSDDDNNGVPAAGTILKVEGAMNGAVTLNANNSAIPFNLSGDSLAGANVVFHLCAADANNGALDVNKSRLITVNNVGSANITMGNATCN